MRFLALLLTLTACGTYEPEQRVVRDALLEPYLLDFRDQMVARDAWDHLVHRLPRQAMFRTIGATTVGQCDFTSSRIEIDPRYSTVPAALRLIIYHELVHCSLLVVDHDEEDGHIFSPNVPRGTEEWTEEMWSEELDRVAARWGR